MALEREASTHRRAIAELAEELHFVEMLAARIAAVPWQVIRHTGLLRIALNGRRAAVEIVAERLALTDAAR